MSSNLIDANAPFNFQIWTQFIESLQDKICNALEIADGKASFQEDLWQREGGGGGRTRVIANGDLLEKGGVNISTVGGEVTPAMRSLVGDKGTGWQACGLSMVLHPHNPFVPTFHANWRYFELYHEDGRVADAWFGGGMDLTPYYLFEEDARLFHQVLRDALQPFGTSLYPKYKKECDAYFANHHRENEARGIGGVFYDHLRSGDEGLNAAQWFAFQQASAACFFDNYLPIVYKRKELEYNDQHKHWQEIRRGRYVEFNLIHDRGTLFGLRTNGRTESILMSLPPTVRFEYDYQPEVGSEEAKLLEVLRHPVDWA